MANFEDLRLKDLLEKFLSAIGGVERTRNLSLLKEAGARLQDAYNFFLTAENSYQKEQEQLKNLFSSFNYAAIIVNNAKREGGLSAEDNELLNECMIIMRKCCSDLINSLNN